MKFFRKPTPPPLTAALDPAAVWTSIQAQAATYISAKNMSQYVNTPDSPPTPDLETTWSNEKIVAYRTVTVVKDDGMWLGHYHPDGPSITTKRHGNGETMTAQCDVGCDPSPSITCPSTLGDGCGWYAWKTKEQAEAQLRRGNETWLVARVLLWGTVIEYTEGYRAQYLAVDEIYETPDPGPVREVPRSGPGSFFTGSIVSMKVWNDLQTTTTQVMNDPLVSKVAKDLATCGEWCEYACGKGCTRTDANHQTHVCDTSMSQLKALGIDVT